jgi:hypothetical protein
MAAWAVSIEVRIQWSDALHESLDYNGPKTSVKIGVLRPENCAFAI